MRANPRTRIRPAAHTHAHIHIHTHVRTRTHVYAHAKEIFWQQICSTALSNRAPSSIRHHTFLLFNTCTIHINIGTTLAAASVQTVSICHHLPLIYINLPIIRQLSNTHLPFIITTTHHLARIIFHLILCPVQLLTILSICQYVIKPCQFYIYSARPYTTDYYLHQLTL